jgi:hypothetical protein
MLKAGGYLCLHDYCPAFPGVVRAVDRFIRENPHYTVVDKKGSLIVLKKEVESPCQEVTCIDTFWAMAWAPILQVYPSFKKRYERIKSNFQS